MPKELPNHDATMAFIVARPIAFFVKPRRDATMAFLVPPSIALSIKKERPMLAREPKCAKLVRPNPKSNPAMQFVALGGACQGELRPRASMLRSFLMDNMLDNHHYGRASAFGLAEFLARADSCPMQQLLPKF